MRDIHRPAFVLCEAKLQTCLHSCVNVSVGLLLLGLK